MEVFVMILLLCLMVISALLIVVGLPGVLFVAILVLISGIYGGTEVISPWLIVVIFIIAALVETFDVLASSLGAKKFGGSNWAIVGAVFGTLVSVLTGNLLLLLVAPLIGATIAELVISRKDFSSSFNVGIGTFIGYMTSIIMKLIVAFTIIIVWIVVVVF